MANRLTHEWLAHKADKVYASWTPKQRLAFMYFNPNGLYQRQSKLTDALLAACEAGRCKSGALLVHGGDWEYKRMNELFAAKRVKLADVRVLERMWLEAILEGEAFIANLPSIEK